MSNNRLLQIKKNKKEDKILENSLSYSFQNSRIRKKNNKHHHKETKPHESVTKMANL